MFKKRHIITTSAIITLILSNVSYVQADKPDISEYDYNDTGEIRKTEQEKNERVDILEQKKEVINELYIQLPEEKSPENFLSTLTKPQIETLKNNKEEELTLSENTQQNFIHKEFSKINDKLQESLESENYLQFNSLLQLNEDTVFDLKKALIKHNNGDYQEAIKLYSDFLENLPKQNNINIGYKIIDVLKVLANDNKGIVENSEFINDNIYSIIQEEQDLSKMNMDEESYNHGSLIEEKIETKEENLTSDTTEYQELIDIKEDLTNIKDKENVESKSTKLVNLEPQIHTNIKYQTSNHYLKINHSGYSLDSLPWGMNGSEFTGYYSDDFIGEVVQVRKVSTNGNYMEIYLDGNNLGWIDYRAFLSKSEKRNAMITRDNFTIDDKPWGTKGFNTLATTADFFGGNVDILTSDTSNNYYFIAQGESALGWVDARAFNTHLEKTSNFILHPNYSIDGKPWGEGKGAPALKGSTNDYLNEKVHIYDRSDNGKYYFVKDAADKTLGWVDARALSSPSEHKEVVVVRDDFSIDTQPWGTKGFKKTGSTIDYFGEKITIIGTDSSNKYYFAIKENTALGWIDARAFTDNKVKEKKYILYPNYSIDGKPWGEGTGAPIQKGTTNNYLNQEVNIYNVSENGAYFFVKDLNNITLGWIDARAFSNPIDYRNGLIVRDDFSIDTQPWGTDGFEKTGDTLDYFGEAVNILGTDKSNNYYFTVNSRGALGWIDKRAFSMNASKSKRYILYPNYSIDGKPWGKGKSRPNNKGTTNNHLAQEVYVYDESNNGTYYFVKDLNEDTLGWIDYRAFSNPTDYKEAIIVRDEFSIDSKPWGEPGYKKLGTTAENFGETVKLLASDSSKNYYFIVNEVTGFAGWVDYRAVSSQSIKEINYILYPNYSIDNKPWGIGKGNPSRRGKTSDYLYQQVYIEDVSSDNSYYFIRDASDKALGWVDSRAFRNKIYEKLGYNTGQPGSVYYYIQKGDTLKSIANKYNKQGVTVEKLVSWNNFSSTSDYSAGNIISLNGMNDYKNYNHENISFKNHSEFLDYVGEYAKEVANESNLYASIMIAQAALESAYGKSALATSANNFFGIKSSGYNGYSVIMPTWEEVNGQVVNIGAAFRFYPTYYHSFMDNMEKLRKGLTWDANFYDGTWIENTNNFKDATLFLTGRYATDSRYYYKLNNIILTNNLTRYDKKSYVDNTHYKTLDSTIEGIYNLPPNHLPKSNANYKNIKVVAHAKNYINTRVQVTHVTRDGNYANIYLNNKELGWVSTKALK